jgi:hypothetical protein
MRVQDMFWGDRYGRFTDPYGQQWAVATHKEDLAAGEIKRRQDAFFAKTATPHERRRERSPYADQIDVFFSTNRVYSGASRGPAGWARKIK